MVNHLPLTHNDNKTSKSALTIKPTATPIDRSMIETTVDLD